MIEKILYPVKGIGMENRVVCPKCKKLATDTALIRDAHNGVCFSIHHLRLRRARYVLAIHSPTEVS